MSSLKLILPCLVFAFPTVPFVCGGGGQQPPPPTGIDAIVIETTGKTCCNPCNGCPSWTWQARNLRGDVGASFSLIEEYNTNGEGPRENWQPSGRPQFQMTLNPAQSKEVDYSMCSSRIQNGVWCVGNYRYRVVSACTFDQSGCQHPHIDTALVDADCISSISYYDNAFTHADRTVISELYDVISHSTPYITYKFNSGIHDLFGGCKKGVGYISRDTLDVQGETCTINITLPKDVNVLLKGGAVDQFNQVAITTPGIIRGKFIRSGNRKLNLFTIDNSTFLFLAYMKIRDIWDYDALQTIEARGGNLYFKGSFICFQISEIPTGIISKKKTNKKVAK